MNLWRNKSNGQIYIYLSEATDCTNIHQQLHQEAKTDETVIYCHELHPETIYARWKPEFLEKFEAVPMDAINPERQQG